MISERTFASSFNDFWQNLLPLLTPSFVHLINSGHCKVLVNEKGEELPAVMSRDETRDPAVVSEFAYHLSRQALTNGVPISTSIEDKEMVSSAQRKAIELINMYEGRAFFPEKNLNKDELQEGYELAQRYETLIFQLGKVGQIKIPVPLCGAGFIGACNADLVIDDYLVEIKTVKRGLSRKDIRQLVIYLALNAASGHKGWKYAGFFNPRRSTYHKLITTNLIEHMSGGRSSIDVFSQLIDFTCSSDVLFDSVF
jgi:hypothetical protein